MIAFNWSREINEFPKANLPIIKRRNIILANQISIDTSITK